MHNMDIVSELRKGSTAALHAIHELFYPALRQFATGLLGDVPAGEDIVTDIFIILWRKQKDFDNLSAVKAFLYISTRNACINQIKKTQRDRAMKEGLTNFLGGDRQEFVLNEIIRAEVLQQIYEAIESLPLQCRRVFKMCYIDGMSNGLVAEKMKISINTVKNHKVRALGLLRLRFFSSPSIAYLAVCSYVIFLG